MDGLTEFTTDSQPLRLFASPRMTTEEFMQRVNDEVPRTDDVPPAKEYAYRRTETYNQQGARVYAYIGERARA